MSSCASCELHDDASHGQKFIRSSTQYMHLCICTSTILFYQSILFQFSCFSLVQGVDGLAATHGQKFIRSSTCTIHAFMYMHEYNTVSSHYIIPVLMLFSCAGRRWPRCASRSAFLYTGTYGNGLLGCRSPTSTARLVRH
jgi:hypothetical protein